MRAIVGDVIGTADGRYGEVIEVGQKKVTVKAYPEPNAEPTQDVSYFVIDKTEVASIR